MTLITPVHGSSLDDILQKGCAEKIPAHQVAFLSRALTSASICFSFSKTAQRRHAFGEQCSSPVSSVSPERPLNT
jgi:hypothetical protein